MPPAGQNHGKIGFLRQNLGFLGQNLGLRFGGCLRRVKILENRVPGTKPWVSLRRLPLAGQNSGKIGFLAQNRLALTWGGTPPTLFPRALWGAKRNQEKNMGTANRDPKLGVRRVAHVVPRMGTPAFPCNPCRKSQGLGRRTGKQRAGKSTRP